MKKTVLITGASAGIGKALAEMLKNTDYQVIAASRKGDFSLDITDENSVQQAVQHITAKYDTLAALVCNAGNGIAGAIEDMSFEELRYQMETNFFGTVRTIQAFLPLFRRQGFGKIVVTASVAGVVPIPFQSAYSASKAAIMILCDALALELKPFNIQVCCVLPGDTKTNFTATRKFAEKAKSELSPYKFRFEKSVGKMEKDEQNGVPPEKVAHTIFRQLERRKMKLHTVVGLDYQLICWAFGVLPTKLKMWIVGLLYG